jgi:hypothetical protein
VLEHLLVYLVHRSERTDGTLQKDLRGFLQDTLGQHFYGRLFILCNEINYNINIIKVHKILLRFQLLYRSSKHRNLIRFYFFGVI